MSVPITYSSSAVTLSSANFRPRIYHPKISSNSTSTRKVHCFTDLPKSSLNFSLQNGRILQTHFILEASASTSVGSEESTEEPATKVKFLKYVDLPGCSSSLSLVGTGYREKVFAIIGVKVYAAGLYVNPTLLDDLSTQKGKSVVEVEKDSLVFQSIYQSSLEKSLQIVLVRDVDGKTFWDALDEAVSPRVTAPTQVDETALSTFRSIFQGRSLKKGTSILLTWLEPSKMLVSVSTNGLPEKVDETIESMNVTKALFDVFLGESPVSPTLKTSVATGLAST